MPGTTDSEGEKSLMCTWRPDGLCGNRSFKENWRRVWWRNEGGERDLSHPVPGLFPYSLTPSFPPQLPWIWDLVPPAPG